MDRTRLLRVAWLVVIFAGLSLFAEPTPILIASILLFAISVSSALLLIVDLNLPFDGAAEDRVANTSLSRLSVGPYPLRQKQVGSETS